LPLAWPGDELQKRSPDLISAGERAAVWIGCAVCEARVTSLLNTFKQSLAELKARDLDPEEDLEEHLGGSRSLCEMKDLAKLMQAQGFEVVGHANGSASLARRNDGDTPSYSNRIEQGSFHYKSFAVQRACAAVFRRGFDVIASSVAAAYNTSVNRGDSDMEMLVVLGRAARRGCHSTPTCRQEDRRRAEAMGARPEGEPAEATPKRQWAVDVKPGGLSGSGGGRAEVPSPPPAPSRKRRRREVTAEL